MYKKAQTLSSNTGIHLGRYSRYRSTSSPIMASTSSIYLDFNATTPIWPEVQEAMIPYLNRFGNPSSSYPIGKSNKSDIESARSAIATMINASQKDEICFCSCGTEADNWAIWGTIAKFRREHPSRSLPHVITSSIEHPAITEYLQYLSSLNLLTYTAVPVSSQGLVDVDSIRSAITENTVLITIMHSNNEIGSLQPIKHIASLAHKHGILVHTDAAQSIGKVSVDVTDLDVDMCTIVGHKFGAPKGIAALYIKNSVSLDRFLCGGGQERNRRAGTENILHIVAMRAAAEVAYRELADVGKRLQMLRDELQSLLLEGLPPGSIQINGPSDASLKLPNTLSVSIRGVHSAALLYQIEDQIAASAGAACHSSSPDDQTAISSVLQAMGIERGWALGTLRLSVGRTTTREDVKIASRVIIRAISETLGT